jgi:two-component system, NtrC family, response regulator GlrR
MSRQILVIDDTQLPLAGALDAAWRSREPIRCYTETWSSVAAGGTARHDADVMLAVPPPHAADPNPLVALVDRASPRPPVIAVLPATPAPELLEVVARRADDFMVWRPDRLEELRHRILRLLASTERAVASHLIESLDLAKLVGRDPHFVATLEKIPIVARTGSTVLIVGETGTGKELCARAVHHLSPRRARPFIPVDCGALPEQLVENELFGHARGAFTDAHRDQNGLLNMAQGGTLFLDEIDSLTQAAQAKILRLLEDRTFRPLGCDRFVHADVRIVAATSADLPTLVHQRRFRADLYFRLNVLQLRLPPLRERPGDIPLLARHFADRVSADARLPRKTFAPSALEKLARWPWPGNVRELFNVVQNAVVLTDGPLILGTYLPGTDVADPPAAAVGFSDAKARALEDFERGYVEMLLRKHAGNITRSAREARKDRRAFARLVKKHRIDRLAV